MKTAVSLPDPVFERAEQLARSLGITRSRLYAAALERYLDEAEGAADAVTEALNIVHDANSEADGAEIGRAAGRRLIDSGGWDW